MIPVFARTKTSSSAVMPAPVGGWNTSENWSAMDSKFAIRLDNYFPESDRVTLRKGSALHFLGLGGRVETLMVYIGLDGAIQLFAVAGNTLYDVTVAGEVGVPLVSSLTNSKFEYVCFGTLGGQYLIAVNGDDAPLLYDGTTWSTTAITGPDQAEFAWVQIHQRRLWFGLKHTLDVYYLAVDTIAGAALPFYLGAVAQRGGHIQAMGTWTRDSGTGFDDVAVFATSEGELLVYQGTNPAAAATWSLVGVYYVGRPIGRRCFVKLAGDLVFLSDIGLLPMSQATINDISQSNVIAYSRFINDAFSAAVRLSGTTFGWCMTVHTTGHMLIVNVPITASTSQQYVFNTLTGAACKFTGLNALCWASTGVRMFFGDSNGNVKEFGVGNADDDLIISGEIITAFNQFGASGTQKAFKRVSPIIVSANDPQPALHVYVDYNVNRFTGSATSVTEGQALWGVATWGVDKWGSRSNIYRDWHTVEGEGIAASLHIKTRTTKISPSLMAIRWTFVAGGVL